jgi:UDP-N-acetylmuramoylalanine--D-glutamate ligase
MIDLIKGKKVMVIGMARSGVAAAELLSSCGAAEITVTDKKQSSELEAELSKLESLTNVKAIAGNNSPDLVTPELSLIVKSPGVPPGITMLEKAELLGIPVISEVELAYNFIKAPIIGVTGTNGKTTTTALIAAMLSEAGFAPVVSAGNIGNPLCELAGKFSAQGFIVAELSSFQLDNIKHFRPFVALFLNFAEDHLDYHGSIEKYFEAKSRITENQGSGDYLVLNAGDTAIASLRDKTRATTVWFDSVPVKRGAGLEDGWIVIYNHGFSPAKVCPVSELTLPGNHNLDNVLAATAAAWAAGADSAAIGRALRSFKALEHRLEHVVELDGVDYINDSKGTNPGATIRALQSFPGRSIILIAGGKDKKSDFGKLAEVIKANAKELILLGETKDQLASAVEKEGFNQYQLVDNLVQAVEKARAVAEKGDLVLLSPACASWDMFKDYEERGNYFKMLVLSGNHLTGAEGDK